MAKKNKNDFSEGTHILKVADGKDTLVLSGENFSVTFDKQRGAITRLVHGNQSLLSEPLLPYLWRVPTDNDEGGGNRSYAHRWRQAGRSAFPACDATGER